MCKSGVYQIILKEDGRSYVGSAINIKSRWRSHKLSSKSNKSKQVIAKALQKYGEHNFEWKVLEYCLIEDLVTREQFWLDTIRPFADEGNGFNIRKIADSNFGIVRTLEARKKQSNTMKGVPKSESHKQRMSEVWHLSRTPEYFKALSDRMSGDKNPAKRPEVAAKISESMKGKTWKEDTSRIAKHINARTGKKYSEEAKKNMSLAQQKNKTRSKEAKESFYLAQRNLYEITSPTGTVLQLYSRELKVFCKDSQLSYANLITTAKTNKPYKGGWQVKLVTDLTT
jgi:group I intron endonuclease